MTRPEQERLPEGPSRVPSSIVYGMLDVETLDPAAPFTSTLGDLIEYSHTNEPPRCKLCTDSLTIVDRGGICRQCRLEGRHLR